MEDGGNSRQKPAACVAIPQLCQWVLFCLLALSPLSCKEEKTQVPTAEGEARSFTAAPAQDSGPTTTSVPGIADRSLNKFAGTMDARNQYVSTVMVAVGPPEEETDCSGVLLSDRLVLTAAHCVCARQEALDSGSSGRRALNGSTCSKRAFVTTVLYGATLSANYKEETTQKQFHLYEGTVRPHPEFQLLLDEKGTVLSEHANLATLLLDEPVEGHVPSAALPDTEPLAGEPLWMAGYAGKRQDGLGGHHGIRYFRKNKVTQAPAPGSSRIVYEQQGPYLYHGYPGGPCFREEDDQRWLVGIASSEATEELSCTSTYFFKRWIQAELQHASQQGALSPPDSGTRR